MNVALIGTPGSGKSELASALARDMITKADKRVAVVDGYVPEIELRTDLAIGAITGYLGNFYVALDRYAHERIARRDNEVVITCGTMIETSIYLAMSFIAMAKTLSEHEKTQAASKVDAILRMMAILYGDIVDYDQAFYLPAIDGDEDAKFMDKQLQAGLAGFELMPVTVLMDPTTRVEVAMETLSALPSL